MIKDVFKIVGIVILTLFLILSISLILASKTLSKSLDYNLMKPAFEETASNFLLKQLKQNPNQNTNDMYQEALEICENQSTIEVPMNNFGIEENITLTCKEIEDAGNTKETIKIMAGKIFDKAYYKEYDCNPITCLGKNQPFALISKSSKEYFKKVFLVVLVISIILLFLEFFLYKRKKHFFIKNSILWLVISIPAFLISSLIGRNVKTETYGISSIIANNLKPEVLIVIAVSFLFLFFGIFLNYREKSKVGNKK